MINRFMALTFLLAAPLLSPADTAPEAGDQKVLREIEDKVALAKEGVHQTKARLRELEEAVLRGRIAGSKAFITFENRAEGFFTLASAEFYLDGKLVWKTAAAERKEPIESATVFDGDVPAGDHALEAKILYRGSDDSVFTMFSYFKDHQFELKAKQTFGVDYGKTTQVKLVAMDRGYFKKDVGQRLLAEIQVQKDWSDEGAQ